MKNFTRIMVVCIMLCGLMGFNAYAGCRYLESYEHQPVREEICNIEDYCHFVGSSETWYLDSVYYHEYEVCSMREAKEILNRFYDATNPVHEYVEILDGGYTRWAVGYYMDTDGNDVVMEIYEFIIDPVFGF